MEIVVIVLKIYYVILKTYLSRETGRCLNFFHRYYLNAKYGTHQLAVVYLNIKQYVKKKKNL